VAPESTTFTDEQVADIFDRLGAAGAAARQAIPFLTLSQLALVAESAPWGNCGANTLLDLDVWGVAVAAALRNIAGMVG
jgi:hypothetical protein